MKKDLSALKEARFNAILDSATILLVENPTASMNEIAEYAGLNCYTPSLRRKQGEIDAVLGPSGYTTGK